MTANPRSPRGSMTKTSVRAIEIAQRRRLAVQIRSRGLTLEEVAEAIKEAGRGTPGYNREGVRRDILAVLKEVKAEGVADLRATQQYQLNLLFGAWWPKAMTDEKAAAVILKVMERTARLNGLDAPAKVDLTAHLPMFEQLFLEAMNAGLAAGGLTDAQRQLVVEAVGEHLRGVEAGVGESPRIIEALPA